MVRATGSYPVGHKFESHRRYHQKTTRKRVYIYGPFVKRLRHHPFTVVTWVRVPYGSPAKSTPFSVCFFAVCAPYGKVEEPIGFARGATELRRHSPRDPLGVSEIPVRVIFAVARTTWGEPTVRKMHGIFFAEGSPFMGNGKPPYGSHFSLLIEKALSGDKAFYSFHTCLFGFNFVNARLFLRSICLLAIEEQAREHQQCE